ncbi:hypothetical protein ACLKA6_012253 [Drosophila palustris]
MERNLSCHLSQLHIPIVTLLGLQGMSHFCFGFSHTRRSRTQSGAAFRCIMSVHVAISTLTGAEATAPQRSELCRFWHPRRLPPLTQ